mmetsp:Transcript_8686/g.24245  ORF Transcript_8686/g.24245 Transcript_8686/m.24245 type:complete len:229 (+) Transcript_8686:624-1310(+)
MHSSTSCWHSAHSSFWIWSSVLLSSKSERACRSFNLLSLACFSDSKLASSADTSLAARCNHSIAWLADNATSKILPDMCGMAPLAAEAKHSSISDLHVSASWAHSSQAWSADFSASRAGSKSASLFAMSASKRVQVRERLWEATRLSSNSDEICFTCCKSFLSSLRDCSAAMFASLFSAIHSSRCFLRLVKLCSLFFTTDITLFLSFSTSTCCEPNSWACLSSPIKLS